MTQRENQIREMLSKGGHTVKELRTLPNLLNQILVIIEATNLDADDFQRFIDAGLRIFDGRAGHTYEMTFNSEQPQPTPQANFRQLQQAESLLRAASAEVDEAHSQLSIMVYGKPQTGA
jgi:hypothetical protein